MRTKVIFDLDTPIIFSKDLNVDICLRKNRSGL